MVRWGPALGILICATLPAGVAVGAELRPAEEEVRRSVGSAVTLDNDCEKAKLKQRKSTSCTVTVSNLSQADAAVTLDLSSSKTKRARVKAPATGGEGASGAFAPIEGGKEWVGTLRAQTPATQNPPVLNQLVTSISDGASPAGYLPLTAFGTPKTPIGDEGLINFVVPTFTWIGRTYSSLGISSNGYVVVGGGDKADGVVYDPPVLPTSARPNNVIAPWWADLNPGAGACVASCGLYITTLTDGASSWIVVEWQNVPAFSDATPRYTFQVWLQIHDVDFTGESVSFAYGTMSGATGTTRVGAENQTGTSGAQLIPLPTSGTDFVVDTATTLTPGSTVPAVTGGTLEATYKVSGKRPGKSKITATLSTAANGAPVEDIVPIKVKPRR